MSTRSKYRNGKLAFFDPAQKHLWTRYESRSHWHEDFDTLTTIPGDGSKANGTPWVQDITGAAPPVVSLVADGAGGQLSCALTSDSQAQDATAHFDDTRYYDVSNNVVFQAYAQLSVLPTLVAEGYVGLMSDHAAGSLNTTYRAGFLLDVAGAVTITIDDNATVTSISTGLTLDVSTWYSFRIETFDVTKLRFYINGVNYGGGSATPYAATGANAVLQPALGMYKSTGAGVGTLLVDSVDIWQD